MPEIEGYKKYREIGAQVRTQIGMNVPDPVYQSAIIYLLDALVENQNKLIELQNINNDLLKKLVEQNQEHVAQVETKKEVSTKKVKET